MRDILKARAAALLAVQALYWDKTPSSLDDAASHLKEALRLVECIRNYERDKYERQPPPPRAEPMTQDDWDWLTGSGRFAQ